ncbi:unnamed protein product, partial [Didymodactylos carnosus]
MVQSVHYVDEIKNLDWIHISQYHLDNRWSPIVCKNAWEQICNDRINQKQWTEHEEQLLINLVEREQTIDDHGIGDKWPIIADIIKNHETTTQFMMRTNLRPSYLSPYRDLK